MPKFEFTVDTEEFTTSEHRLTPGQIMEIAAIDPTNHFLKQIVGKEQISYQDKNDEPITMHNKMEFISIFSGSHTVSDE